MSKKDLEEGSAFEPQFDTNGLMPCITTCASTGEVLMLAYMNAQSLEKTIQTGEAHYWSRSRQELWHKGSTSGAVQKIVSIRTDCDQDCLLMRVDVQGDSNETCHTGRKSCFYRELDINSKVKSLKFVDKP